MASARQCVEIFDTVLHVTDTRVHHERLRDGGLVPSTQGKPTPLASAEVARLLISVLVGAPCADGHAALVAMYAAMRPGDGGPTFGDVVAGFIDRPNDLFELRIAIDSLESTITFRQTDHNMATIAFRAATLNPRPAYSRYAVLDGGLLVQLVARIAAAPELKPGRRRRARRFQS
jgi:hypothetical protein